MVVKLRLKRFGRLNHPTYRVCAADARSPRDGRVIETLGYYLPRAKKLEEQSSLNTERIAYWLSVGAQPSETVRSLIQKAGVELPQPKKRRPQQSPGRSRSEFCEPWRSPGFAGEISPSPNGTKTWTSLLPGSASTVSSSRWSK